MPKFAMTLVAIAANSFKPADTSVGSTDSVPVTVGAEGRIQACPHRRTRRQALRGAQDQGRMGGHAEIGLKGR